MEGVCKQDWTLIKELGRGISAPVKVYRNTATEEKVVVKTTDKRLHGNASQEEHTSRMHSEYQTMTHLRGHKHIISLLDVQETANEVLMAMEYAEGGDLLDYLTASGRLPEIEARRIFCQLLSAVHHAHVNLIVHRDIKLENIFMDHNKNVKLGDFGFATFWHPCSVLKHSVGSLYYCAPEICCAKEYTGPEVDVWSLGVVLYGMLAGALPFDGPTDAEIRRKIRSGTVRFPTFFSEQARELISLMLAINPMCRASLREVMNHPWVTTPGAVLLAPPHSAAPHPTIPSQLCHASIINKTLQNSCVPVEVTAEKKRWQSAVPRSRIGNCAGRERILSSLFDAQPGRFLV